MPEDLTDAEIDHLLERFDQTDPKIQRGIIARFIVQASMAADLQAALNNAPVPDTANNNSALVLEYLAWRADCITKGLITEKPPTPSGPRREAVKVDVCRCCAKLPQVAKDEHGRCSECLDMVPTRRGGWRQLGVYE